MPSKNLMNLLTAPSRVASKLDWLSAGKKSSVLTVDIGRDRIGMAVAPHPSSGDAIRTLPPLKLQRKTTHHNRRVLTDACVQTLANIVAEHNVCALLVTWPVQTEGRCGKPCGQVLHTLDNLLEAPMAPDQTCEIMTQSRPICLWDDRHTKFQATDEWGRDPHYGDTPPKKKIHLASLEQYEHHECSSTVAAKVWLDFCRAHWPDLVTEEMAAIEEYTEGGEASARELHGTTTLSPTLESSSNKRAPKQKPTKMDKTDYHNRIIKVVVADHSKEEEEEDSDEEDYGDLKMAAM